MVATFALVMLGVSGLVVAGMTGGLVWLFHVADDEAEWESEGRRRLAARTFYLGAALVFLAIWGLAASFVVDVDVEAMFGVDVLMLGVGGVAVASLPLGVGLTLVFDAAMEA